MTHPASQGSPDAGPDAMALRRPVSTLRERNERLFSGEVAWPCSPTPDDMEEER